MIDQPVIVETGEEHTGNKNRADVQLSAVMVIGALAYSCFTNRVKATFTLPYANFYNLCNIFWLNRTLFLVEINRKWRIVVLAYDS